MRKTEIEEKWITFKTKLINIAEQTCEIVSIDKKRK